MILPEQAAGKGWWRLAVLLAAGLLGGCEPPLPQKLLLQNSFDQAPEPGVAAPQISRDQAYSPPQALRVGEGVVYAGLATAAWGTLGSPHHLRLRLRAWVPTSRLRSAMLVLDVKRPGSTPGSAPGVLHSQLLNLCEVVKRYHQWVPANLFVSLPRGLRPTDELVVFMWVPPDNYGSVYIDDFAIEAAD